MGVYPVEPGGELQSDFLGGVKGACDTGFEVVSKAGYTLVCVERAVVLIALSLDEVTGAPGDCMHTPASFFCHVAGEEAESGPGIRHLEAIRHVPRDQSMYLRSLSIEHASWQFDDKPRTTAPTVGDRTRVELLSALVYQVELIAERYRKILIDTELPSYPSVEEFPVKSGVQPLPIDPGLLIEPVCVEGPLQSCFVWPYERQ